MISKTTIVRALCILSLAFAGCAAVEEPVSQVPQRFDEGIRGRGQLISTDPMGDRFGPYYQ